MNRLGVVISIYLRECRHQHFSLPPLPTPLTRTLTPRTHPFPSVFYDRVGFLWPILFHSRCVAHFLTVCIPHPRIYIPPSLSRWFINLFIIFFSPLPSVYLSRYFWRALAASLPRLSRTHRSKIFAFERRPQGKGLDGEKANLFYYFRS